MQCLRCGQQINENDTFCTYCGERTTRNVMYQNATISGYEMPQTKKNNGAYKIIIALLVAVIILLGGITFMLISGDNRISETTEETVVKDEEVHTLDEILNEYIETLAPNGDIAVAVIDNKTENSCVSTYANNLYSAWGFYLPVYIAFCEKFPSVFYDEKKGIMSNDPGVCNSSANYAMELMGGTYATTRLLQDVYNLEDISYARYFGQSADTSDNYTSAKEAAILLCIFNKYYSKFDLSYNLSAFGITEPDNCRVYAQIGTEDISVKNNLNLFAIVNGENSDYSIAILTQNNASANDTVSKILAFVHNEMERLK